MKVQNAQARHEHEYGFRAGQWADVIGMVIATPDGKQPRLCTVLRWPDGAVDYVPCDQGSSELTYRAAP